MQAFHLFSWQNDGTIFSAIHTLATLDDFFYRAILFIVFFIIQKCWFEMRNHTQPFRFDSNWFGLALLGLAWFQRVRFLAAFIFMTIIHQHNRWCYEMPRLVKCFRSDFYRQCQGEIDTECTHSNKVFFFSVCTRPTTLKWGKKLTEKARHSIDKPPTIRCVDE